MDIPNLFIKAVTSLISAGLSFAPVANLINPIYKVQNPGQGIQKIASCTDLKARIANAQTANMGRGIFNTKSLALPTAMPMMAASGAAEDNSADYSTTNVQVEGVDEADLVKIDGSYAYHLSNNQLLISRIAPANQAKLVSTTKLEDGFYAQDLYVEKDRVMVIGNKYENQVYPMPMLRNNAIGKALMPQWRSNNVTVAQVWNISDRSKPKMLRTVEFDGSIASSRMISGNVYLIMNSYSPYDPLSLQAKEGDLVPAFKDSKAGKTFKAMGGCADVLYYDPQPSRDFLVVASLPISGQGTINRKLILGTGQTIYSSTDNLYVARQEYVSNPVRDSLNPDSWNTQKTVVYKFAIKNGQINYKAQSSVPGTLLNQFSMDEYKGNLRLATTKGQVWDSRVPSTNNVYVLSSDMKLTGTLEGMAPGEKIYSVRFMGDRGYVVTFKKVDPLFVLDLSDAFKPSILGKLKIPGYSDYLHPMDATHIIGVGKNASDAPEQSFAWYQGIKMAVFDVSDVANPKEMYKVDIGDRGTDSPALTDHKAFLYSPTKQILSLPIRLAELSPEIKSQSEYAGSAYGDYTFQGAYVYRLTLDKGFEFLGRVTHHTDDQAFLKSGYYYGSYDQDVSRVLYTGDSLLTFSNSGIYLNHLNDLKLQSKVAYPEIVQPEPIYYEGGGSSGSGGGVRTLPAPAR
jgi:uncharacterized secreted protein with C-terminal beta-propeller domain